MQVCPNYRRAYVPGEQAGTDRRVVSEQKLSGICSWGCYNALNGGTMKELFGGEEWDRSTVVVGEGNVHIIPPGN